MRDDVIMIRCEHADVCDSWILVNIASSWLLSILIAHYGSSKLNFISPTFFLKPVIVQKSVKRVYSIFSAKKIPHLSILATALPLLSSNHERNIHQ